MPYVRSRYYREEEKPAGYRRVEAGFGLLEKNTLFHQLDGYITAKPSHLNAKGSLACVTKDGDIYVNMRAVAGTMVLCDGTQPSAPGVRPL